MIFVWLAVGVAMPLVEAASVDVVAVNVDLQQFAATLLRHGLHCRQQDRADALSTQSWGDVEVVKQRDGPVVPDVRAQRHDGDRYSGVAGEQGEHVTAGDEPLEPRRENGRTRRG